ncbi:hypothetical protein VTL71DRAFT_1563 [Oculimacula yallundae]|uniref:Uncharacterized protein n=1 Tax=Oculimacula yallundae TaxID=86028 RepID=A0ABR4CB61_9HELO
MAPERLIPYAIPPIDSQTPG